ncbi:AP endonuclease [Longispora fulva]|uniref:Putative AlkP superfamily pyrophosphatase or phosphodiesterase n=1 Tax=Longispora fulva TaxID=619741 RepID=A0A8J7KSA5_9ACTN|nr:alkaline phosphatase family protein [Longispora fulva]MBG6139407.1 putative AlkP superfamily pyrophosphatase or phosphodiesterase [Longispora fulva]GIG58906.1 AP endonuclease [Longispora fulva]
MAFSPSRRIVVFGVDGVRTDTLAAARTPRIDAIAADGFHVAFELNDLAPTVSGPGWSNVATGVWADKHNIDGNIFADHRLADYPDFLTRLRTAWPEIRTYAAADWPPLVGPDCEGPVFANPHRVLRLEASSHDYDSTGADIALDAARTLGEGDYHAAFVYFGEPDEICHHEGVTPNYLAAVERADARIGQVLDAIRARPGYAAEEWTFVVVTDHGHIDTGGHGGRDPWEARAWIAASGPGIPTGEVTAEHADIAPSVFAALGLDVEAEWGLEGVPFGQRKA